MKYESFSAADTAKIAFDFGKNAQPGEIFCLSGTLGAGKTVFVQGFAKGIGYEGRVTSPTFTIMNEYESGRLPIYHFDLYRLEGADDLESIGYEE
jgi:tRNA threonylcarbamoyladenosine biosynthesis protein TsaE